MCEYLRVCVCFGREQEDIELERKIRFIQYSNERALAVPHHDRPQQDDVHDPQHSLSFLSIAPSKTFVPYNSRTDSSLSGNNVGIIKGMDHGHSLLCHKSFGFGSCLIVIVSKQPNLHSRPSVYPHGVHLDARSGERHDNDGAATQHTSRHGHALCVITGGTSHHTVVQFLTSQVSHFVVGTTEFERKDGLGVFPFEQDGVFQMLSWSW